MSIFSKFSTWLHSLFFGRNSQVINLPFRPLEGASASLDAARSTRPPAPSASPEPSALREGRLDRRAVLEAFDASRPISGQAELFGRQKEIENLLFSVFDFHQHAIIYGARGSGKTSVARVFGRFADQCGAAVYYFPCEPDANFAQLMGALLDGLPQGAISASHRPDFQRRLDQLPAHFGPSSFVDLVAEAITRPVVVILDEFDRITSEQTKTDIAVAMKLLSDMHSSIRIMLVGIASSVTEILSGHPSLRRHMNVTRIGRIEATSVSALIEHGARTAGLPFDADAQEIIERVSVGSPYHVRLICRHAALQTVARRRVHVDPSAVYAGIAQILEQWEETNPADAARFQSAVEGPADRGALEDLAREAARNDCITQGKRFERAMSMLDGSISQIPLGSDQFVFNDSLAPQFLIAFLVLAEATERMASTAGGWDNVATH